MDPNSISRPPNQPLSKPHRIKNYLRRRWKELLLALIVAVAASVMLYTLLFQHGFSLRRNANVKATEKIYSPLSGVETTKELAARPVTGIMIENSPDARPQSGIAQAGVVFEAVAEGGITRFLVLFQDTRPQIIGPVRSLRPYYLDWVMGYDAAIAHVGGSEEAAASVAARQAKDLNEFAYAAYFWRSGDRPAPHNVYTSFDKLDELKDRTHYDTSKFTPYSRKNDEPVNPPTNTVITVDYSGPQFVAQFRYDPATNQYLRFIAGQPDIDREVNVQIAAKNVVIINMPTSYNGKYAVMPSVGSGDGVVLRDGIAIKANWKKEHPGAMLELTDDAGQAIALNRGMTWFMIAPQGRAVTY